MAKGKRFSYVINSDTGKPVPNADVQVQNYGTDVAATLYADAAGTEEADNPMLTDENGMYSYYADTGRYTEIITTNTDTETISDIAIERSPLTGSKAYTPGTIPAGEAIETTVTVADAELTDFAFASFSLAHVGVHIQAQINAAGVATVNLWNMTVADITLAAGTLYVSVADRVAA